MFCFFFFSSRRRHRRLQGDWSSDVCSSDLETCRFQQSLCPVWAPRPDTSRTPGSHRLPSRPPELTLLVACCTQEEDAAGAYAVVARLTVPLKRRFAGLHYERANARWQLAETEYRALGWPHPSARSRTSAQTESRADRSGHHEWT